MRENGSLRPNERKTWQEFKVFESAWELQAKREKEMIRIHTLWERTGVHEREWEFAKREQDITRVQSLWERIRVTGQTRGRVDKSSNSWAAHGSQWECMRVYGQTRVSYDKCSNSLRAHEGRWECTRVGGRTRARFRTPIDCNENLTTQNSSRQHESFRLNEGLSEFKLSTTFVLIWSGFKTLKLFSAFYRTE